MNKIKQNKITFTLILAAITILFSSLTILSLPVLFNYKSKVPIIEKNFYNNFKIFINLDGKISYKPFPKPHLLVENASLKLSGEGDKNNLINTLNLKIFISLRDIYLRSFRDFESVEISNSNLHLQISDINDLREHLYQKINKPIILNNCKIFFKNGQNDVILISPVKKILYKINNKTKVKNFIINGEIFGLNFKSAWKRNYNTPNNSTHEISIVNPNIEIKNYFEFISSNKFKGISQISYLQDRMEYFLNYNNNKITISSPNKKKNNFNLNGVIQLSPFYFESEMHIKNKKVENIIDNILLNLLLYDRNYLGNINGNFKIKLSELNNKLLKKGELDFVISEKEINLKKAKFYLDKIGYLNTNISFIEKKGDIKFISRNQLIINNYIEFAKTFQISSKKIKKVKSIDFELTKNLGERDFIISDIKIGDNESKKKFDEIFIVKNIQNLRSHIRKVID